MKKIHVSKFQLSDGAHGGDGLRYTTVHNATPTTYAAPAASQPRPPTMAPIDNAITTKIDRRSASAVRAINVNAGMPGIIKAAAHAPTSTATKVRLRIEVRRPVHIPHHAAVLHVHVDAQVGMALQDVVQRDRRLGRTDLVAERRRQDDRVAALALVARRDDGRA